MVGGKIIDAMVVDVAKVPFLNVWVMDSHHDELMIRVKLTEPHPRIGDSIWWHGFKAYWTDAARTFTDKPIERIGYSHPPHAKDFAL